MAMKTKIYLANQDNNEAPSTSARSLYSPGRHVIAAAGTTIIISAALRVWGRIWSEGLPAGTLRFGITSGIRNSYIDVALILAVMLGFLTLIALGSRRSRLKSSLSYAFVGFSLVIVALGWVNALALHYSRFIHTTR